MKCACAVVFTWAMLLLVGLSSTHGAPPPETLTLRDLVNRPDRWPAQITITRDVNIVGGVLKPGQKGTVVQWDGSDVGVDMGKDGLVGIGPEDCDLLAAANAAWAKLSPEQRAVDLQMVLSDSSLWPEKITSLDAFRLDSGKDVNPGREYELITIQRGNFAIIWDAENKTKLSSSLDRTDIVARARALVAIEPAKRSGRVASALRKNMIDANGQPVNVDGLDDKKVFLLYYGASWCPPCRQFSPGLVKTINELQPANPNLMVVMLSNDEKDPDLLKYMQDEKMPWPAVTLATMKDTGFFLGYAGNAIPQVTVVDKYGKVLFTSTEMNRDQVMANFKKLIKSGAAK